MVVALEFYIRCLNLRDNFPIPCSFCLENKHGDRKVVSLNEAYRHPELVAVRHWHLSDCAGGQSLPTLSERLVPRTKIFDSDFVIVPDHMIMKYYGRMIPSSLNSLQKPMTEDQFDDLYKRFLQTDIHNFYKETWIWREFLKAYLPHMSSMFDKGDEVSRLRDLASLVMNTQPELWHKWLRWRRYMVDFDGLPGEIIFNQEYGDAVFVV